MTTQQERFDIIEQGRAAQIALGHSRLVLQTMEEKIISVAISEFRGGTMTNEKLWALIGTLSGLRTFVVELQADAQKGFSAQKTEMRNGR